MLLNQKSILISENISMMSFILLCYQNCEFGLFEQWVRIMYEFRELGFMYSRDLEILGLIPRVMPYPNSFWFSAPGLETDNSKLSKKIVDNVKIIVDNLWVLRVLCSDLVFFALRWTLVCGPLCIGHNNHGQ